MRPLCMTSQSMPHWTAPFEGRRWTLVLFTNMFAVEDKIWKLLLPVKVPKFVDEKPRKKCRNYGKWMPWFREGTVCKGTVCKKQHNKLRNVCHACHRKLIITTTTP